MKQYESIKKLERSTFQMLKRASQSASNLYSEKTGGQVPHGAARIVHLDHGYSLEISVIILDHEHGRSAGYCLGHEQMPIHVKPANAEKQ